MDAVEKRLEYHELLMTKDDLSQVLQYQLPQGFLFVPWKSMDDLNDWIKIHIDSGEFMSEEYAKKIFYDYYSNFIDELKLRCFFIVNSLNERIATATISPTEEYGYNCVVDWLAVSKKFQNNGLAKPLISNTLKVAKSLGYEKILLHTQTHSWLAAKLYLDFGFEPFNVSDDVKGWQILKTITNHEKLKPIQPIPQNEMYFQVAVNIVKELDKKHTNYEYQIWHKNGTHEVWVRENNKMFVYDYKNSGKEIVLKSHCD